MAAGESSANSIKPVMEPPCKPTSVRTIPEQEGVQTRDGTMRTRAVLMRTGTDANSNKNYFTLVKDLYDRNVESKNRGDKTRCVDLKTITINDNT